jgi:monoamine oxidase
MTLLDLPTHFPDYPNWPEPDRLLRFPFMKVNVSGKGAEYFTHVVSTASFANLRTIDTTNVPMSYKQRQAIRTLNYGPSVKVAIKFKTRWWEQDGKKQLGGSSYTDRQVRVVVYPSYGLDEGGPGVLMVTYNW